MTILLAVLVGLFTTLVLVSIFMNIFKEKITLERRVRELVAATKVKQSLEDEEMDGTFYERVLQPFTKNIGFAVTKFAPMKLRLTEMERLYAAGQPKKLSINEWLTLRFLITITGSIFGIVLFIAFEDAFLRFLGLLFGILVGLTLPSLYLSDRIKKRKASMLKSLPDAIDLLSVSVEAGLGFDAALTKVVDKFKGVLGEEFNKALQEMKMGKTRKEALKNLVKRNPLDELQSFVNALIQADQMGVSVSNVLRVQSEDIRQRRKQAAEEKAMKAPIKILFPLILFIFPSLFVIILGPAVINIVKFFMGN